MACARCQIRARADERAERELSKNAQLTKTVGMNSAAATWATSWVAAMAGDAASIVDATAAAAAILGATPSTSLLVADARTAARAPLAAQLRLCTLDPARATPPLADAAIAFAILRVPSAQSPPSACRPSASERMRKSRTHRVGSARAERVAERVAGVSHSSISPPFPFPHDDNVRVHT